TAESDAFDDRAVRRLLGAGLYPHVIEGPKALIASGLGGYAALMDGEMAGGVPRGALSSGLAILSRFPILESHEATYGDACDLDDCGANKGALQARLALRPGATLDLFTTHLQ